MTGPNGIGGNPGGPSWPNNSLGANNPINQGGQPPITKFQGLNGPNSDIFTSSIGPTGSSNNNALTHNVDFGRVADMSMPEAANALVGSTFQTMRDAAPFITKI